MFNIFRTEKGDFIFDPANPRLIRDDEGDIVSYYPSIFPLEEGEFEQFMEEGESIEVTLDEKRSDTWEPIEGSKQKVSYST